LTSEALHRELQLGAPLLDLLLFSLRRRGWLEPAGGGAGEHPPARGCPAPRRARAEPPPRGGSPPPHSQSTRPETPPRPNPHAPPPVPSTLSLHDALPISALRGSAPRAAARCPAAGSAPLLAPPSRLAGTGGGADVETHRGRRSPGAAARSGERRPR